MALFCFKYPSGAVTTTSSYSSSMPLSVTTLTLREPLSILVTFVESWRFAPSRADSAIAFRIFVKVPAQKRFSRDVSHPKISN